jgi:putative salt-induced outer membrane protein YdiY
MIGQWGAKKKINNNNNKKERRKKKKERERFVLVSKHTLIPLLFGFHNKYSAFLKFFSK